VLCIFGGVLTFHDIIQKPDLIETSNNGCLSPATVNPERIPRKACWLVTSDSNLGGVIFV